MTNSKLYTAQPIITGFGPFAEHSYNPSWDAAQAMAEKMGLKAHRLPVTFDEAARFAHTHLRATAPSPVFFVHLGLAADRSSVAFEIRAKNERSNASGASRVDPLIDGGPSSRSPQSELTSMVDGFNAAAPDDELQAQISRDCGRFVCNALLYHSLGACEKARQADRWADAVFIHIPKIKPRRARRLGAQLAGVFDSYRSEVGT